MNPTAPTGQQSPASGTEARLRHELDACRQEITNLHARLAAYGHLTQQLAWLHIHLGVPPAALRRVAGTDLEALVELCPELAL